MRFLKYEFSDWASIKPSLQQVDEEGNESWIPSIVAAVELGNLCVQWGTDEEGNPVCEQESSKFSVDILWNQEDESLASFIVWPEPCGVHVFAGWEQAYAKEYCEANPDAAYCQPPAPIEE